ncbi:MAG: sulfatase-like hydrolase/transferase [Verrucomicrobia bacterium]|nr:sulfatase-like hydrolase/transferase [Verrucomicrobiota bacterium]
MPKGALLKRIFLIVFGLAATLSVSLAQRSTMPNILFLFADDQRADTIFAHGNSHIKTPNIDRLAASGFSFRRNYVLGSNSGAVCMPSRAMLMSSKTWFRVDNNLTNARLLPELLRDHGYLTFATGKWHNGEASWLRSFDRGKAVMFGGMSNHERVPVKDLGPDGRLSSERIGDKFSSELFADAAIEFLRQCGHDKPFFAYVAFIAPHDPRMPPVSYREMYYRNPPPLPENYLPQLPFDNGMMNGGRDENLAPWPRTPEVIRDQLCEYYGLITHLDEQIGRILDALKESGHANDTIVIYSADNGLALGSHGLLGKQSVYEHSMRVPLIVSGPGIPKGKETHALTCLLDVYPTLCDLIGISPPPDIDGVSLRSIWNGTASRLRDSVFLPFTDIQRAVVEDRWKLVCYPKIAHFELFDLHSDPHERTNLVDNPSCAPEPKRLTQLMKTWQTKTGDKLNLPTERKPLQPINLTGKSRKPDQWQPDWIVKKYFD